MTVVKGQKGNRSVENKNVLFYWDDAFAGNLLIQNNHNRSWEKSSHFLKKRPLFADRRRGNFWEEPVLISELHVSYQIQGNMLWKAPSTCKTDQDLVGIIQAQGEYQILDLSSQTNPHWSAKFHLRVWSARVDEKFMRPSAPHTTSVQTTPAQVAPSESLGGFSQIRTLLLYRRLQPCIPR